MQGLQNIKLGSVSKNKGDGTKQENKKNEILKINRHDVADPSSRAV
jgi:hypothetical protein